MRPIPTSPATAAAALGEVPGSDATPSRLEASAVAPASLLETPTTSPVAALGTPPRRAVRSGHDAAFHAPPPAHLQLSFSPSDGDAMLEMGPPSVRRTVGPTALARHASQPGAALLRSFPLPEPGADEPALPVLLRRLPWRDAEPDSVSGAGLRGQPLHERSVADEDAEADREVAYHNRHVNSPPHSP
jgi:hypothetical protein